MRTAKSPSAPSITTLIERSEEPWAIAKILISLEAKEAKNVPAIPRFCFIPSPTMETMAQFSCTSMGFTRFSRISNSNSLDNTSCTAVAWAKRTQKLMVYSELDWVINKTEIPARETAAKIRAAIPLRPFIPEPDTLIIAVPFKQEIPRTEPLYLLKEPVSLCSPDFPIRVPFALGLWLFKLHASMPLAAKGARVLGWSTFEPKKDNSMASS